MNQIFQSTIGNGEQSNLFEVRMHEPPAAPQVFIQAIFGQLGERLPHRFRRRRRRIELTVFRNVGDGQARRIDDSLGDVGKRQRLMPLQRRVQRRAQQRYVNKVVEVAGWNDASWRLSVKVSSLSRAARVSPE